MRDAGGAGGVTVVKLGGSFAFSPHLKNWIGALIACAGRVVVVPGGGPFADAVRDAQPKMGFDDRAAHFMAALAMDQFGHALVGLDDRLTLADTFEEIGRILRKPAVPVWLPSLAVVGSPDIPCSWDVTSDSLAAWLAGQVGAKRLVLVKRVEVGKEAIGLGEAVRSGAVDAAFARFLTESRATAVILGPSDLAALAAAVDGTPGAGARIVLP